MSKYDEESVLPEIEEQAVTPENEEEVVRSILREERMMEFWERHPNGE